MSRPPVTTSGTRSERRSSIVSGPGQHASASVDGGRWDLRRPSPELVGGREVHDQRMVGGAALHVEDPGDGVRLRGVGGEPVDRLGGDDRQPTGAQARGGPFGVAGRPAARPGWRGGRLAASRQRTSAACARLAPAGLRPRRTRHLYPDSAHAAAPPEPRLRPHVRRRVHGPEPVDGPVAPRRRPHDPRRHRHDACRSSSPT